MTATEPIPYAPGDRAWHEARRSFLGASDVPAVLGLSPYRGPLDVWAEKVGLIEPGTAGSLATRLGHELEDMIARLWAEEHPDADVRHDAVTIRHPEHPWLAASTDREVGSDGLLECKLVGAGTTAQWDDGVPAHVIAQCHTQLAVTGRRWVDVCSLHAGRRWEHRVQRIDRDDRAIGEMVDKLSGWWHGYVVTGRRPEDLGGDPERARRTLGLLYPGDPDSEPVFLPREMAEVLADLKRSKALAKDIERTIKTVENDLIAMLGDATDAFLDPDQPPAVTYRPASRQTHDLKAIEAGRLDGFTPDEIATARRVLAAVARTTTYRTLRIR